MATLGLFTQARSPEADTPMARLFETVMRGNAEMASGAAAKRVASEQMDAAEKTSITIDRKGVTVKNADPSLLNGTQDQEVKDAADAPHLNVESSITDMKAAESGDDDPLAPIYDAASKHLGYRVPRPSDRDIAEKLQTPDGIRELTREMGGTDRDADAAIRALRDGKITVQQMRERVAAFRVSNFGAIQEAIKKPLDEAQDIQQNERQERTENRLQRQQYIEARNQLLDQKNIMQFGSEQEFVANASSAMDAVGGLRAGDEALLARAYRTERAKVLGDRVKSLSGEEGRLAIQSYGDTPEEIERFVDEQAGAQNLSEFERTRFRRTAKGLIEWRTDQERKEVEAADRAARAERSEIRAIQTAARAEATAARSERTENRTIERAEKTEKQGKIDDILKGIDANNKEIIKNNREIVKPGSEISKQEKAYLIQRNRALQVATDDLADELEKFGVKLKSRESSTPPKNPKVGQRFKYPNGKIGEWDGQGWAEVK